VVGPVTVGTGTGFEAYLEPGARGVTGRLLIQRELTFNSDGELQWQVDSDRVTSDHVVNNGLTIIGDAENHFGDFGNSVIPVGTVFTMFSNTATTTNLRRCPMGDSDYREQHFPSQLRRRRWK